MNKDGVLTQRKLDLGFNTLGRHIKVMPSMYYIVNYN